MQRALAALVVILLVAGAYGIVTGAVAQGTTIPPPRPQAFGYALAAGMIVLGVTYLISRPRLLRRR